MREHNGRRPDRADQRARSPRGSSHEAFARAPPCYARRVSLRDRIWDDGAGIDDVAAYLDGLGADERLAETRTLSRADQRRLYEKAASARPLTLDDFVPAETAARAEVIHDGRNTLPLPGGLKLFQKRFCRPEGGGARL